MGFEEFVRRGMAAQRAVDELAAPRYSFTDNNVLSLVPLDQEPRFFRAIEALTGLDEPAARAILDAGQPIEHPRYQFRGIK